MANLVSLPNPGQAGSPKFLHSDDPMLVAQWLKAEDGRRANIYDILNPLEPGATRHGKENMRAVLYVFVDIDAKDVVESLAEIEQHLRALPLKPTWLNNSGHGWHVIYELREEIERGTEWFERVIALQEQLIEYFGGDRQVRLWSLLRRPGTTNYKEEPFVPCYTVEEGSPVDITEIETLCDLVAGTTLLTRKTAARVQGNEHGPDNEASEPRPRKAPVDTDQRLADVRIEGPGDAGVHNTELSVTASLLRRDYSVDSAVLTVLEDLRKAVDGDPRAANWNWTDEELRIRRQCTDFINKHPELADALPDDLRGPFKAAVTAGRKARVVYARHIGWHVRSWDVGAFNPYKNADKKAFAEEEEQPSAEAPPKKYRFKLLGFDDLRPGPERLYLVDELIPIAGLVDIWGKAKCYKSFFTFDLMFHVAMGWEYRDRQVQQGTVVYCAFEGAHGYKKRTEALRRHYAVADGEKVPLHVMPGQANLIADHKLLISDLKAQLGDTNPVAVVLDTLNKSLHGSESSDEDMGKYVRAAEAIRDAFGCVVIIVHHCGYDTTHPRGHTSLPGAVDAQLQVVKLENEVFTVKVELMRDGPEDTELTSQVKVVEVGRDCTGKTLTSLVVVPSGVEAGHKQKGWPRSMTVFHDALRHALAQSGEPYQDDAFSDLVRAADMECVREEFYSRHPADGDTEEKRKETRRKAFNRAVSMAQNSKLIGVKVEATGRTMMWPGLGGQSDDATH